MGVWAGGHGRGAGAGEDSIVIMIMNLVTNILGFMIYSQLEYIWAGRGCDIGMGWVCGLEGTGEELCGNEGEVVVDWEGFGLCVKMPNGCHLHTAGGYSEGLVLDDLELGDI